MSSELTAAILLGADRFPQVPHFSNPAFKQSKEDLKRYLLAPRPHGLGIPTVALLDLFNSEADPGSQLLWIGEHLKRLRLSHTDAVRNVVVYYVGHGYHAAGSRELQLALAISTEKGDATALRATWLTRALNEHVLAFRFFYLMDCCFAGKVLREGQGDGVNEALMGALRVPRQGSAALCATPPDDLAMAPRSSEAAQRTQGRTVFSDALIEVLTRGDQQLREGMTLADVHHLVMSYIEQKHRSDPDYLIRPYLDWQNENDLAHRVPIFPNPAVEAHVEVSARSGGEQRRSGPPGTGRLAPHLIDLMKHATPGVRLVAVKELSDLLADPLPTVAGCAREALQWLASDGESSVAAAATAALARQQEKIEAERSAAEERLAKAHEELERQAREVEEARRKAEVDRKAEEERIARAKEELERRAREVAEAERKAEEARRRASTRKLRPGDVFREGPDFPEMVVIPRGRFLMGSPDTEPGRVGPEGPVHAVNIDYAFAVGKYPVTRGEWRRYLADSGRTGSTGAYGWNSQKREWEPNPAYSWSNPGFAQDDSHPVVCITWEEATLYAAWVSEKTRRPYRLLSEAEYEYVNRAGSQTRYFWGDSEDQLHLYANGDVVAVKDRFPYTSPVGSFEPNRFGLYDTTGNVWSWTQDYYHDSYKGAPTDGSAWEEGGDGRRVVRGGSWVINPGGLRAARRDRGWDAVNNVGLRLARTS